MNESWKGSQWVDSSFTDEGEEGIAEEQLEDDEHLLANNSKNIIFNHINNPGIDIRDISDNYINNLWNVEELIELKKLLESTHVEKKSA